jgi:hypothetical protein
MNSFSIMATDPPDKVPATPEPVTSRLTKTTERECRADGRSGLIMRARDGDALVFRGFFGCHCPYEVNEEGDLMFLKNGGWYPAGPCPKCKDVGPARWQCLPCSPPEVRYELFGDADETMANPRGERDPSSRSVVGYFDLLMRVNIEGDVTIRKHGMWHPAGKCCNCGQLGAGYYPCTGCTPDRFLYVIANHEPDGVDLDPHKLGTVAELVRSTLRDQPDPEASCRHFILLLESFCASDEPGRFD